MKINLKNSPRHHHLQSIKGEKILYIFVHRKGFILGGQKLLKDVFISSIYYIKLFLMASLKRCMRRELRWYSGIFGIFIDEERTSNLWITLQFEGIKRFS